MRTYLFSIISLLLLLAACQKDSLNDCIEHETAPCRIDSEKTNIRVENISNYDFCNLTVDAANYGILNSGRTTCYVPFELAYRYNYVRLFIGEKEYIIQPIDYVGETPLGVGRFTYRIDVADINDKYGLTISARED